MIDTIHQYLLKNGIGDDDDLIVFIVFGLIISLIFFAILGISTGRVAMIL